MAGKVLWSSRSGDMDDSMLKFTSSLDEDEGLAFYDIMGSVAHVMMLGDRDILSEDDVSLITDGLRVILGRLLNGELELDRELEDVHTNVEVMLTDLIGPAGGKLHTGRSRNDQVSTDLRMYLRDAVLEAVSRMNDLIRTLTDLAQNSQNIIMPGFTHMQHAQPVTAAHHMMAHAFKLGRDADRFMDAYERINICPLGAGAVAGTTFPIDRKMTSDLLGFRRPMENSMDCVSDRDFVIETAFCASLLSVHLSSMAEELIIWSTPEFGFIEMDDKHTTGSSMLPQKKNPDAAELIRGRTGSVIGDLVSLLTMMKGLPLTYNRDMQEDKRSIIHAVNTVIQCTTMMSCIMSAIKFNSDRMLASALDGYMNATDLADYLVSKGIPFREAHNAVASAVRYCILEKKELDKLKLSEMKGFSDLIEEDVFDILPVEVCVERRNSFGGTSQQSTMAQIFESLNSLIEREDRVRLETSLIESCWKELTG